MARIETWFNQDLQKPVKVQYLDGNVFSQDNNGNLVGVVVFNNGSSASLSGSVSGSVIRADGGTVAIDSGTLSGNKASIVLPQAAYAVPGVISIIIKLTSGSVITTLCAVVANVYQSSTNSAIDPGTIIPSIETLIAAINNAVASIPADYSSLWTSLAPAFSSGTYSKGQYVTYNGKLYQFTEDHSGSWTGTDVAVVSVGNNLYIITNRLADVITKANAAAYNLGEGWFVIKDSSFTSSVTHDDFGVLTWHNNTPTTALYNAIAIDLGTYGNVKNIPYALEIQNDSSRELTFTLRLSKQGSWAPTYSPVIFGTPTISKKEQFIYAFIPKEVLANEDYSNTDHVFAIIEQATHPGASVNVGVKLLQNTPNAIYAQDAEYAKHAGIEPFVASINHMTTSMSSNIGATISGVNGRYKIAIPQNSGASGQTYASIAIPAKQYIAKGNKLRFTLKKSNTTSIWNWDAVRLSTSYNNWAPTVLVQLLVQSPGNVSSATYEVDLGSYGITPSSYTEIYLIFDTFVNNPVASSAVDLTVDFVLGTGEFVIATGLEGFIQDDYYNKAQVNELIGQTAPVTDMIFWGDSLTAGAGGGGTTYCAVCAGLLGKSYKNCGVGGETEQTIAARQGGNNLVIPAGNVNGNYSFSQMLDETGKQILPLRQGTGSNTVNPVLINGQSCTLSLSDETYTISGYTGTLSFATPALFSGFSVYGDITVIFVGTNGLGSNTVAERISYIQSMISRIGRKYVVMGISYGNNTDRAADDAAMREAFGNHFFPTRKMLVNYGLAVAGITPTTQDNTDIASGTVPTSLRSDHVHLNASGYTALGTMLASFIVGLGYADYPSV